MDGAVQRTGPVAAAGQDAGEPAFRPALVRQALGQVVESPSRHKLLFASCFLAVLGASALGLRLLPSQYLVKASVLVRSAEVIESLAVPYASRSRDEQAAQTAANVILRRENLVELCRKTDFVRRHLAGRGPLGKARDWIARRLGARPASPEDLTEGFVDGIEDKLSVTVNRDGLVTIAFLWSNPELAYDFVRALLENFLKESHDVEVRRVADAIAVLEAHEKLVRDDARKLLAGLSREEPAPSPEAEEDGADDWVEPHLEYEHRLMKSDLLEARALFERTDAARVELAVAEASFNYRFSVLQPPRRPAGPLRSPEQILWSGGLLGGLALALFASTVAERSARRRAAGPSASGGARGAARGGPRRARGFLGRALPLPAVAISLLGVATVAAVVAGRSPVLACVPALGAGILFVLLKVPLRWSAATILFLLLVSQPTVDSNIAWVTPGLVATPFNVLGDLLIDASGVRLPFKVAGVELLVLLLAAVGVHRRLSGSRVDGPPPPRMVSVLRFAVLAYLAGFLYAEGVGLARGQSASLWKIRYLLYVPGLCLFFYAAFRNLKDFRAVGAAVVWAAQIRGLMAAWVQYVAGPTLTGGELADATNHGDSILFAMAIVIAIVPVLERSRPRDLLRAALLVPLPFWGIMLNRRRTAYAMLEVTLLVIFLMSSWRPWKRKLTRALLVLSPVVLLFLVAGWNSGGGGIFSPVHKLRTMLDPKIDPSTYWRDVEAWNVTRSMEGNPILGAGLGGEYQEFMFNDDVSGGYKEFRAWPHNTVLGLIFLCGFPGFLAIWLAYPAAVFLAARAYRAAKDPEQAGAALICIAAVICCLLLGWADTGAHFSQYRLCAALALALAGRLALAPGVWAAPGRVRAPLR